MHVVDADARIEQMVGQVLRHALGERRHQHALVFGNARVDFIDEVVDLTVHGAHVDLGVEQAGGADDLLHVVLAHAELVVAGRGAHIDELRDARLELVKTQGPVIQRGRRRNPCSTSVTLRERSPSCMPRICGTVTWLSSMMQSMSLGK